MTLQASGSISFSQIVGEHGGPYNLNAYRGSTYFPGAPSASSPIDFSDFYSTSWYRTFTAGQENVNQTVYTNTGYRSGAIGTFGDPYIDAIDRTITALYYYSANQDHYMTLNATSTAWTSITITGSGAASPLTLTRASATLNGTTYQWATTSPVFTNSTTCTVQVNS